MPNSCLNCRWASWQMTAHIPPRINPNKYGDCSYRVGPLLVPKSVDYNEVEQLVNPSRGRVIWPYRAYIDCPCWQAEAKIDKAVRNDRRR